MTPQQMALSRLARRALSSASESTPADRAAACRDVAAALSDSCPDLARLAARAASRFEEAHESHQLLIDTLNHHHQP